MFSLSPGRPSFAVVLRALLLVAGTLLAAPGYSQGQAQPAGPGKIQLGVDGKLKVGSWTPVRVELSPPPAAGAEVIAVTTDFENNRVETPLVAGDGATWSGVVQVGRLDGNVAAYVRKDGVETLVASARITPEGTSSPAGFRQSTEFWGVLGTQARFADAAAEATERVRLARGPSAPVLAVVLNLDWNSLPVEVDAWDALDLLVIGGDAFQVPAAKNETLRKWVERGGRLLIVLGSGTEAYQKSPVAAWSPIKTQTTVNVTSLEMVNARVPGSASLRVGLRKTVPAAQLPGNPEGTLPGPAVLGKPYGLGMVTAFAFDFDQPPLSTWENQTALLKQLTMPFTAGPARAARDSELTSEGVTDLASQLASGLDRFDGVNRTSFREVMVWTALWMIVLFPLDYLVVHRVLKRPHLTWVTLPFLIAGATLMASRSAAAGNTAPMSINQIDLLDFNPGDSNVRVRSWMTFYSGETSRYDIAGTSPLAGPARLGWNAKPEEGLRGLYRQGGISLDAPVFQTTADHTRLKNIPVRLWSSYSVKAESTRDVEGQPPLFESTLSESDAGRLQGDLRHNFPGPLHEWIVLYKNFVYHPVPARGELAVAPWEPGVLWRPSFHGQSTLVRVYLQGRREVLINRPGQQAKLEQVMAEVQTYDPAEFDPNRFVRILSFHDAAGGAGYTGLANAQLAKLDLSRMLDTAAYKGIDQAVVIARIDGPAMNYEVNGTATKPANSWTFVRAVLPVKMP